MLMDTHSTAGTVVTRAAREKGLSAAAIAFAEETRGISRETLELLGVASGMDFFPQLERKSEAVFFPYFLDGECVNYKAAAFPEKAFTSKKGGSLTFFNLDAVLAAKPERVYVTEGEWDAAALVEAGVPHDAVMSVPNGARERAQRENEAPTGYEYVEEALRKGLNKVGKVVWCGDADGPGRALRSDMAKLFGAAKFMFVDWPEGCKDANDYLRTDGKDAVRELVTDGALPWPVSGLYRLSELPEMPALEQWHVGVYEWTGKLRLAPRTMSVVTGHPGHGKTAFWTQMWFNVVRRYCIGACIATFETLPKPHMNRALRSLYSGKREKDMDDRERAEADRWINERYWFLNHPEQRPTLDWLLDTAEVAIIRGGAKILQIDPWNRLETQRHPKETETEYIGRCLTSLYVFAQDMNVHVQVLAHPAKLDGPRKGKAPELEDISGSKHWDNRVDQGFVVHRPKLFEDGERCFDAELHYKKSRFVEELGYPCKLKMKFNPQRQMFEAAA